MITPNRKAPIFHLSKTEWVVFGVIFAYSFIPAFGGLIRVLELAGGPQIAPANPRALLAPTPIILHTLSSFLFCIVGAVQFLPSIRRQRPAAHRVIGRVIAVAGCMSALTGLWMTHFYVFPEALQGAALYWVRVVLGTAMIGLITWAVIAIRSRNVFQHGASMVRAYAIGQGASTQAVVGSLDHRCWLGSDGTLARRADDLRVGGQSARRRNLHTCKAEAAKASAKACVTASYSAFHTKK